MSVSGAKPSRSKKLAPAIEQEPKLPSPIPEPPETEKKASLVRFERIIKEIEGISLAPESQNNALAFLFYSLINATGLILNTKNFRKKAEEAAFSELMKGLEVLLDQIVKINNNMSRDSHREKGSKKTIQMSAKIRELEVMRQEISNSS